MTGNNYTVTYDLNGKSVTEFTEELRAVTSSRIVSVSWDVEKPDVVTFTLVDDELTYTAVNDYPDFDDDFYDYHEFECRTCGKETSYVDDNGDCSWCRMVNNS